MADQLRFKIATAELDLHGMSAQQAERAVRHFLHRTARLHAGEVVRIITGRGTNSGSAPVLGPAIERQLESLGQFAAEWQPALDGGSFLVRLR